MKVNFYEHNDETLCKYAVIIARYQNMWVFVRHKERDTWEIPGGKREKHETMEQCARRELYEESGALDYTLTCLGIYGVKKANEAETFGMLYVAQIYTFAPLPPYEMAEVTCFSTLPKKHWTYPQIQPILCEYAINKGMIINK